MTEGPQSIDSAALLNHAKELYRAGTLKESRVAYNQLIGISADPTYNAEGFYGLGLIDLRQSDFEAATTNFRKCLHFDPLNANAYFFLGEIAGRKHLSNDAEGFYRKAIEINPTHQGALKSLQKLSPAAHQQPDPVLQHQASPIPLPDPPPAHTIVDELHSQAHSSSPAHQQPLDSPVEQPRHTGSQKGFYEYIKNDPSALAKQTLELIDSIALSATPRLSAFAAPLMGRVLATVFVPLFLLFLLTQGPKFISLQHAPLPAHPNHLYLDVQVDRELSRDPREPMHSNVPKPPVNQPGRPPVGKPPTEQGLAALAMPAALIVGICLLGNLIFYIVKIKATQFTFDRGRLKVESGVFARSEPNFELYRVEDVSLSQTFTNRLTGDGDLVLQISGGHGKDIEQSLRGIANIDDMRILQDKLRNLVLLLRTGAWGKGVIY